MARDPILLIGGAGFVGRWTARMLKQSNPDQPLLIAGRDIDRARDAAASLDDAQGVVVDLARDDLGLGGRPLSAVAVLFPDSTSATLRFALARGVPYVGVATGLEAMPVEVAHYMQDRANARVALGTEWLVGATTMPTLERARRFARLDDIRIGALLDEEDAGGPAWGADLDMLTEATPPALTRRDGAYLWRTGDDLRTRFRAVDGTEMEAFGIAPNDVVALAAATGAANVEFNLAFGTSSSRRRGQPMSTEIVVDLAGVDHAGRPLRTRHAVVHPQGQFPVTGLGTAMVLERLVGLDGHAPAAPGLYFPHQLLDSDGYLARLTRIGGSVQDLPAA